MILKIKDKEYNVQFGYKATLKTRLLSRMAKFTTIQNEDLSSIEDILLFVPEILLVGLQKHHSKDFGFDLDNNKGYEEQKERLFDMLADTLDEGELDCIDLFNDLQEEMLKNGFLKKMFEREVETEIQKQ